MEYKTDIKYGIFVINDAKYLNGGALKVELINDQTRQYHDTMDEAVQLIADGYGVDEGNYIIMPVVVKKAVKQTDYKALFNF